MSKITYEIDLSGYSEKELINCLRTGFLTAQEIVDSGVMKDGKMPFLAEYIAQYHPISKEAMAVLNSSIMNFKKGLVSKSVFDPNKFKDLLEEEDYN